MALNTQRPVLCAFLYPPRCLAPPMARVFSSSPATRRPAQLKNPTQPALSVELKRAQRSMQGMPTDIGLLPKTLVMPTGARLPSAFGEMGERLAVEWARARRRAHDLFTLFYYKFYVVKKPQPRPKLALSETAAVAKRLHHDMYVAFAAGDAPALRRLCTDGLHASFAAKLSRRPRGEVQEWSVDRYIGKPRVVSNRAAALPDNGTAVRQAIVRIRSVQTLKKAGLGARATEAKHTEVAKTLDEYVVIQKIMLHSVEGPWMVWGTTKESDIDIILERDKDEVAAIRAEKEKGGIN